MSAAAAADLQKHDREAERRSAALHAGRAGRSAGAAADSCRQEFQQRLEPVLQQVATDMGLQFVFNGPDAGLVWADAALDISAEVIKKLDSAKPPAAKPASTRRSPRVSERRASTCPP